MLTIYLRDRNPCLVSEWQRQFEGFSDVHPSCGDIFDVKGDAVVSPANSFGHMDGGIDLAYCDRFGFQIEARLQALLLENHFGELPVGQAIILSTGHQDIPFLVSAPTMRAPGPIPKTVNVYLAFRAALIAVHAHNRRAESPIQSLLVPGLGTGVGKVPERWAARQMRIAYEVIVNGAGIWNANENRTWLGNRELLAFVYAP